MKEIFGMRSLAVDSSWMVAVIVSWWGLDGCCYYFLVGSGWLMLLFPGGVWMVNVIISWWDLDGCCYYFLVGSGWLMLFPDGLWMVTGWALDGTLHPEIFGRRAGFRIVPHQFCPHLDFTSRGTSGRSTGESQHPVAHTPAL